MMGYVLHARLVLTINILIVWSLVSDMRTYNINYQVDTNNDEL